MISTVCILPREARDLISKIRSCTVRSDLKNKQKTAENALCLRSDLTVQDRILEIRSLASLHTRCIVKTGGFTRGVCKNRGLNFKVFLWNF